MYHRQCRIILEKFTIVEKLKMLNIFDCLIDPVSIWWFSVYDHNKLFCDIYILEQLLSLAPPPLQKYFILKLILPLQLGFLSDLL